MPPDARDDESDAALWLEATHGSPASFATIFDRHRVRVFRKAYHAIGNAADAEDVVAMVFLEAWRKRDDVRIVDGSVLPWLLATTTYVTLNLERTKRRHRGALAKLPVDREERDWSPEVDEDLDRQRRWVGIRAAVAKLSEKDQQIIQLSIVDGLGLQQVADVLDVPVGTVKSRLSRARERLREELSVAGFGVADFGGEA